MSAPALDVGPGPSAATRAADPGRRWGRARSALGRVAVAVLQLAAVSVVVFALTSLLPGDTATAIAGADAPDEQIAALRIELGLDRPPLDRFLSWAGGVLTGDLGTSLVTDRSVAATLVEEAGATATLALCTAVVLVPLAVGVGVLGGRRPGSLLDRALTAVMVVGQAVPEFAIGVALVAVFALQLGLLPATAAGAGGLDPTLLVLPVAVIVLAQLGRLARQVRIGVVENDHAEHVAHLRRLGLGERVVLWRHVVPGAVVPAVQQLARVVDGFVSGIVVVEALFVISGIGSGFVAAVQARDLPMVQAYALVLAATTIGVNLLADLVTARLVPQRETR